MPELGKYFGSVPTSFTVNSVVIRGVQGVSTSQDAQNAVMYTDDLRFPFDGGNINTGPFTLNVSTVAHRNESGTGLESVLQPGTALTNVVVVQGGKGANSAETKTTTLAVARVVSRSTGDNQSRGQHDFTIQAFGTAGTADGSVIAFA